MRRSLVSWVFLMQFVAVFFEIDVVLVAGQCQKGQRDLLLQFKNSVNFTSSVKLVKWNQGSDCCGWDGVRCDAGGHVIDLDLSSESISGGIVNTSSLFNLQHLQSLNLADNSFNSSIPAGVDRLANLSYLNLSSAGFSGQIPLEISRLTSLGTLDLSVSFFLGSSMKLENPNLAMLVRNLKELKQLYLDGVDLSAQGKEWCQALSNSLPKLEELSMSYCLLLGSIDSSLSKIQSLSVIHLGWNNLSGPIPEFFATLSDLTSLNLAATGLEGKVPEGIFQIRSLKALDLSGNSFLNGSFREFLPGSSLETLLLGFTSFGGNLPESIGNLERLSVIDLRSCNFNGSIPNAVGKLTHLVYLDLSINSFSGQIPSLSSAKDLTQLYLSHNQLTGSILSTEWSGLLKLETIDLRNNSLNGTIPSSLFGIPALQRMLLLQNHFTGELNEPPELASFLLDTLELSANKLAGPFPFFMSRLQSLKILALSFNNFSGPVNLSSFHQMRNLSSLDLSYNSLLIQESDPTSFPRISTLLLASCMLTTFPAFLKEQTGLFFLDLSDNQIGGEIPNWLWNFTHLSSLNVSHNFLVSFQEPMQDFPPGLVVLDLHSNNLEGQLSKLPLSASYLDYSDNNFNSVIPASIGSNLEFVFFFSLSNNNFHGSIPESICKAYGLIVLDLSENSLTGAIPQCLIGMNYLGVLNLRGNVLGGNIPDNFSSNCLVRTADFHGNQLEGKIPRSLSNCVMLEVLDLGSNRISDGFPFHLKNIASLRVLVLRSNNFHGPINCPDDSSSWPVLQIVDLATNYFSGELPVQCLSSWKGMMVDKDELLDLRFNFLSLDSLYYQNTIKVTMKGSEFELVKILTVFSSIDFSCNNFEGKIPDVIGEFRALYVLNLSRNSFTGLIPSSLRNLRHLESLDLSNNKLSGEIPQQLADLNFLSVLNLSHNQLEGRIPSGSQFQTFSEDSFKDNKGLCGVPLKESCSPNAPPPNASEDKHLDDAIFHVNWNFISVELGFFFGLGIFVLPLMFWRRWRIWYCKHVDALLSWLLPQLNQRNRNRGSRTSRRTRARAHLMERNKMVGEAALQPQVSKHRTGRRTGHVVVV